MAEKSPWGIDDTLITPQLLDAVKYVESRGNVNAVSKAGARGPYQFMPATAKQYALADPHDEPSARDAAGRYLTDLANQFGGDVNKALLAYNWGPGNVRKGGKMPLEAQQYVGKVRMAEQKGKAAPETAPWEVDDTPPWEVDDTQSKKTSVLPKATVKENSMWDEGKRQLGLTGRYALEGAMSIPAAIGNVMAKIPGLEGAGGNLGTTVANKIGLPTADREAEKVVSNVVQTAAPGAAGYKAITSIPQIARAGPYFQSIFGGGAAGAAGETAVGGNPVEGAYYGAALGPVGTAAGNLASGTVRGARRLFSNADDTTSRYLRELSTDPIADAATLRALRGEVAGEMPTSGMAATVDPRMQYLAAIERQTAARATGGRHFERTQANEAARMAPLENIAAPGRETFNPLTRQMEPSYAQGERSRVTGPMYENAMGDRVAVQPTLAQVLRGAEVMPPAAKGGRQFAQEQTNAAAAGRGVPQGRTPYTEPPVVRDPSTGATMADGGPFMPQVETQSIRELQLVRKNLDDKIAQAVQQGDRMTARRLMEARNQLSGEMTGQSGNFNLANSTFRNMSQPQNAAEIAQVYANAVRDQGVRGLLSARNNTARTLKRADQSSRFQHEGEVLTPQQMQDVNAVTRSAQRQADLNAIPDVRLPRQISAAEELEQNLPGMLSRPMMIARKILQRLGSHTDEQVRAVIDEASLNPQRMADLLERIPASERQNFIDAVRAANPRGAITGTITGQIGQE